MSQQGYSRRLDIQICNAFNLKRENNILFI